MPGLECLREADAAPVGEHVVEVALQHADVMPVDALHLADFGKVDIKVGDVLGAGRELSRVAGNPVVKPAPMAIRKSQSSTA